MQPQVLRAPVEHMAEIRRSSALMLVQRACRASVLFGGILYPELRKTTFKTCKVGDGERLKLLQTRATLLCKSCKDSLVSNHRAQMESRDLSRFSRRSSRACRGCWAVIVTVGMY